MSEPPGAAVSVTEAPPRADVPSVRPAPQRVLPLRRPGCWIATAVVLVVAAQFVHGLATNPFYQWDRFGYWFLRPTVLDGLLITLEVTACSAVPGLLGAILLALARLSKSPVLRAVSWTYEWALRSIPLIVVLLFLYHLIDNGQYAKWLAAWNLSNDAVGTSEVNPPGLPLDNS